MGVFGVSQEKEEELHRRMESLGIREAEIVEQFIRGSGKGGQKINKTSSTVYLFHKPTKLEIKCQMGRSQAMNRFLARRLLCDKIEEALLGEQSKKRMEIEKIRRQKRKRSKRAKEKVLAHKKHTKEKKELRRRVDVVE